VLRQTKISATDPRRHGGRGSVTETRSRPHLAIHEEIEAGKLSAALLPWMRDRVLALPRGRPVSRATREVFTGLMQVGQDLVDEGKILVAKPRKTSR
jgi:LysR family nitrogen assimilation transcriptional regulator